MSLDNELDELGHICDGNRGHNAQDCQRAKFLRSEITVREADYATFLRDNWEVASQLDGMQLVLYAFRCGWEAGNIHGRKTMAEQAENDKRYYR